MFFKMNLLFAFNLFLTSTSYALDSNSMIRSILQQSQFNHNTTLKCTQPIVIAIIDSGLDTHHPFFDPPTLWHDPENPKTYGWDFVNHQPNPEDQNGHGTHIAGIIQSLTNKNPLLLTQKTCALLMPLKFYSPHLSGAANLQNSIQAIYYAIKHGAQIINYSAGGQQPSLAEKQAIEAAEKKGILFITAAGNEYQDAKDTYYPASYHTPNMITVTAWNPAKNQLVSSANFSNQVVDLAAPGFSIVSAFPNQKVGTLTGTSQATAFATGIAAVLWMKHPHLTAIQIKQILLSSTHWTPVLKQKVRSSGVLNASQALAGLN